MKSRFTNIFLPVIFFLIITSCFGLESDVPEIKYANGTVKFISLEGGFYGIVTDNKKSLDPLNLPKEFQRDGLRIFIKYIDKTDMVSFHMWGTIVEIVEAKEISVR